jgi:serine/threonine protein kinase
VSTGRVIHQRYLLQQVIERGIACAVYQGFDHVLQRHVAIKVVPAEHISAYRAAIRATSQFSHPNITDLFDLIVEAETLYIVQEHVKGEDFSTILRSSPTPSEVCDLGIQICQALIYAGTSSHKICHGDLIPSSIIREPEGHVRVNNFALPSNTEYFTTWSAVGDGGFVLSDPELPYGQMTEGRRGDDTRAVGLLLYQLLAGRPADATKVEPPTDGRLRFQRNVPPDFCELIARTIVRIHPQRILTAESLCTELKQIAKALEATQAPEVAVFPTPEDVARPLQFSPAQSPSPQPRAAKKTAKLVSTLPARDPALDVAFTRQEDPPHATADATLATAIPSPVSDMSMKLMAARPAGYSALPQAEIAPQKISVPTIIMIGLVFFALFFGIGFFIANAILP